MKRSLSHTTTKRKDDKNKQKQERKFEKRKNQNKKGIKIIASYPLIVAFAMRMPS